MKSFVVRLMGTALVSLVTVSSAGAASLKTWDAVINKPSRFKVLTTFNSEAVLDKETGLVWQRDAGNGTPLRSGCGATQAWAAAAGYCCQETIIGGRGGWRLPSLAEVFTLIDDTQASPTLPAGHPFSNVAGRYWTSTEGKTDPTNNAFNVNLDASNGEAEIPKSASRKVWCLRGPGPQ